MIEQVIELLGQIDQVIPYSLFHKNVVALSFLTDNVRDDAIRKSADRNLLRGLHERSSSHIFEFRGTNLGKISHSRILRDLIGWNSRATKATTTTTKAAHHHI
jgi:hypothetical protein